MKSLKFFFFLFFTFLFLMINVDKVYGQVCSGYVECCLQVRWDGPTPTLSLTPTPTPPPEEGKKF